MPRRFSELPAWKQATIIGSAAFAALLAAVGLAVYVAMSALMSSVPYQRALGIVRDDPLARAALGEPIEAGWHAAGSLSTGSDFGEADLTFPVSGPRRAGEVQLSATRDAAGWSFQRLALVVDGEPIDLLETPESVP